MKEQEPQSHNWRSTNSIFSPAPVGGMKYDILFLVLGTVLLLFLVTKLSTPKDTIFLCTTYFDCPKRDGWAMFQNGISKLKVLHEPQTLSRIDKWVVINEYSSHPKANWAKLMNEKYPFITFLQKSQQDEGQAKSLNMLLNYAQPYTYWFHWEEGWEPTRPFLNNAFSIMDTTNITQLQLSDDWINRSGPKTCKDNYCIIQHTNDITSHQTREHLKTAADVHRFWPHYSLRPSLNRVAFYKSLGEFSTDKFAPPLTSEHDYAVRWYNNGGTIGVFKQGPLKRPNNYISTHD